MSPSHRPLSLPWAPAFAANSGLPRPSPGLRMLHSRPRAGRSLGLFSPAPYAPLQPGGPVPTERRAQPAWLMCPSSHLFSTSVSQVLGGALRVCTARAELRLTTPLPATLPCSPVPTLTPPVTAPATISRRWMGSLRLTSAGREVQAEAREAGLSVAKPQPRAPVWPPPLTGWV